MKNLFTLVLLAAALAGPVHAASELTCVDLRCEFLPNPVGVDREQPRLSWRVEGPGRAQRYIAHRIIASSSAEALARNEGDLWDSGRVDETVLLYRIYGGQARQGKPLATGQEVHWKVMVWDGQNQPSAWSNPARFTVGLADLRDWEAQWISFEDKEPLPRTGEQLRLPSPRYYRKEFNPGKKVKRALALATALGLYELQLNGQKVGDAYLTPGWSDYRQRVYYNTYDVTGMLKDGANCIGAIVADGWYAGYVAFGKRKGYGPNNLGRNIYGKTPALSVQLRLEFEDGSSETIGTDPSWQVRTGPESDADLLMGETYNASAHMPGWSTAGFDTASWKQAILASANKTARTLFIDPLRRRSEDLSFSKPALMDAYPAPPVRVTEELPARSVTEAAPGKWIFDFGQNFAGVVRLKVKGSPRQRITIRYGEMLHPDGSLMTENLGSARATDTYVCRGSAEGESWSPRFTYHGFRYAEVSGLTAEPPLDTLTGLVLHNDLGMTSGFACSDPLLNKIHQNCLWTLRSNLVDIPTNCPQRDERLGWALDAQLSMSAGCLNMDARAFYGKWLRELQETLTQDGFFPTYAPLPFGDSPFRHGTAWSDAGLASPYILWRMYGEREVIQKRWRAIEKYVNARLNSDPKLTGSKFGSSPGDLHHLDDPTPIEFIDLCYLGLDARLMMEIATITSGPIAFNTYRPVVLKIMESFQDQYINEDGSLKVRSQTAHALALRYGLVADQHRPKVLADLLASLEANRSDTHSGMTTGILGTKPLLNVLTQSGHGDEAIRLVQSRKFPSWGFSVENGATTTWERPDAFTRDHGFKGIGGKYTAETNSFSHLVQTSVSEWLISSLAGIAAQGPGFEQILLQPTIPTAPPEEGVEPITWVRAHYDSARGRIAVHWKKQDDGSLLYEATIPAHTQALLKLPARDGATITESGRPVAESNPDEVRLITNAPDDGRAWFLLGSGSFRFEVR